MDKKNKIFLIVIAICTLVVVGICAWAIVNHESEEEKKSISDNIKFKEEYESYNGKTNDNNNIYPTVTIDENNTVKYLTELEVVEMLENGTGLIYFGFDTCPWCRSMIGTLTSVAKENHTNVYYLDVLDIRSKKEVINGNVETTKTGTDGYYNILKVLDKHLSDYIVTDEDGKEYKTDEKRLFAPTVVTVKDGEILKVHIGTVETQKSGYDALTEKQISELNKIFTDMIKEIAPNSCSGIGC